jgi:hypothetical protein
MARALKGLRILVAATVLALVTTVPAAAQEDCTRSVVVALPGVLWTDIELHEPPNILRAIEEGAWGSMSVRTNSSRTSLASGFVTMGAGARVDGGVTTGGPAMHETSIPATALPPVFSDWRVAGVDEIKRIAEDDGYGAQPGALAGAMDARVFAIGNGDLGRPAPAPIGYGRWTLLSAMNPNGVVDAAATSDDLLLDDDAAPYGVRTDPERLSEVIDVFFENEDCGVAFIDQGDLTRFDQWAMALGRDEITGELVALQRSALMASDELVGDLRSRMGPDELLLVVSPTSPSWADEAHLGVAVAVGGAFGQGTTLESASTRRSGLVTLPDVAPTILEHFGVDRPPVMNGRGMASSANSDPPVASMTALNDESVFIDAVKGPLSAIFVLFQVVVYVLLLLLLGWRERRGVGSTAARTLQMCGLAVVAFPVSTYLAGVVDGHSLGGIAFGALLVAITAVLVLTTSFLLKGSMDRLLALVAFTWVVVALDLVTGSMLQLNTVFGYSPIVAGRFAGAGNIVFAVFGVTAILTGALVAYRFSRRRFTLPFVVALFVVTVIIDGAPSFGSDVGGVLALVPSLGLTAILLTGRKPRLRTVVIAAVAGVVALALFLVIDLRQPVDSQTHLARLYEDTRDRGFGALGETLQRKATSNLRVFTSTIWTFFVPPALLAMIYLLRRPSGRWQQFAVDYPKLRAGLIGGLLLAVLGFAVNDSGIVIPAVILSFLVPMALLVHLAMEAPSVEGPAPARKEVPA